MNNNFSLYHYHLLSVLSGQHTLYIVFIFTYINDCLF